MKAGTIGLLGDGTRTYVWGPELAYGLNGGTAEIYHLDGEGSVWAVTDSAGALI